MKNDTKGFHPPQSEMKKHNDLSNTKKTLHVFESIVKVERILICEKYV